MPDDSKKTDDSSQATPEEPITPPEEPEIRLIKEADYQPIKKLDTSKDKKS